VLQTVPTPFGDLRFMGSGFKLAHGGGRLDSVAPALGTHTEEALREAGFGEDEIDRFRAEDVI
jgi:crotonobetainyl-CoA:carnitine CoA-transferase CaiB-like acyl-CoA transferase